jgi:hypothetical protein
MPGKGSAQKVDLLILGDGYTAAEHETFVSRAKQLSEELFSTSPFKERRSDFNVWAIAPATALPGVSPRFVPMPPGRLQHLRLKLDR